MKKDQNRKKVDKIHKQINKLALKGKDSRLEYAKYIEELIDKGEYAYFEMCVNEKYGVDISSYKNVHDVKKNTWKSIVQQTDSDFISNLRKLYKDNKVYQQSFEIRSDDPDYSFVDFTGPYITQDISLKRGSYTSLDKTIYQLCTSSTMSQINLTKQTGSSSNINLNLLDPAIYKVDIYKVIWQELTLPLYSVSSTTESSLDDLVIVRIKGNLSDSILYNTVSLRIREIYDTNTMNNFIGLSIGSRISFEPKKIYKLDSELIDLLGIEEKDIPFLSTSFEAEILDIRKKQETTFESPYEVRRMLQINTYGTQSFLDTGATYSTHIPLSHGYDYLIKTSRRSPNGWCNSELRHEELYYKVSVRKDNLLGTIKEVDVYMDDPSYLQIKPTYAKYLGLRKTYLEVHKVGVENPITIVYENYAMSEDGNLFERYKIAIKYLNS
jgi:hypothetical protein